MCSSPPARSRISRSCRCEIGLSAAAAAETMAVVAILLATPSMSGGSPPRSPEPMWRAAHSTVAADSEIFQVQDFGIGIVRKDLGVPAPIDDGVEHPLRL